MKNKVSNWTSMGWASIFLLGLAFLLSCLTSLVGVMFAFTGFGQGLASLGIHMVFFSMGMALPVFAVVVAISRKALTWIYGVLYATTSAGIYMLHSANSGATSLHRLSGKMALEAMFTSAAVLYVGLVVLVHIAARVEHRSADRRRGGASPFQLRAKDNDTMGSASL